MRRTVARTNGVMRENWRERKETTLPEVMTARLEQAGGTPNTVGTPEMSGATARGRRSPSFAMRLSSVLGFIPSSSAAPPLPRMRHAALSRTRQI